MIRKGIAAIAAGLPGKPEPVPVSSLRAGIPNASAHLLCRAHKSLSGALAGKYLIETTLELEATQTKPNRRREAVAPLYDAGLVVEWFSPWSPPLFLTERGEAVRGELRRELGYDD